MALLELHSVSKRYRTSAGIPRTALDSVSLVVPSGGTLVVVGASGAGKSTLLRIIAGLENPDSGRMTMDGIDLSKVPPHERKIAILFQAAALLPHLTAEQNIRLPLVFRIVSRSDQEAAVASISSALRIQSLLDRRPDTLSGGEAQRIAIARAVVSRPRLLLLDEPFSHLDPAGRLELQREVFRLKNEQKISLIAVTHDLVEARRWKAPLLLLHDGQLQQSGSIEELMQQPANALVKNYFTSDSEDL